MDAALLNQVKSVFADITTPITLAQYQSEHPKQAELTEMLSEIAGVSEYLTHTQTEQSVGSPGFEILVEGQATGIEYQGIPGGHEFTSLILGVLYSVGQGKQADDRTKSRIQSIQSKTQIEVFVSLECHNCPDVVQASQYMASLNPNIQGVMIDGSMQPKLAEERDVMSVPTVFMNGEKIHTGRGSLGDLLEKIIERSQTEEVSASVEYPDYDVAVIGGGPAGASAAIYSARKGLKVAVIADQIGGQLLETKGIENLTSKTYTEGPQLSADLVKHLDEYEMDKILNQKVESISNTQDVYKSIQLKSGDSLKSKSIIIATGANWKKLGVPGENEYNGAGVAYCPHCDGPLYKGKSVAVVGGGNSGVEAAIDLAGICKEVTLFEFADELKADSVLVDKVNSLENVTVKTSVAVQEIPGDGSKVTGVKYQERADQSMHEIELEGVFVQIGLQPNSDFLKGVVELNPFGEVQIDEHCKTSVEGIFAAGDVSTVPYKQIVIAMGEGAKASLSAFDYHIRNSSN